MPLPDESVKWSVMTPEEMQKRRIGWPNLDKNATTEFFEFDSTREGGFPTVKDEPIPEPSKATQPEEPRRVIEGMVMDMVKLAHEDPEKAVLYAHLAKRHNPERYQDSTVEEIVSDLIRHFEYINRDVTEKVYQDTPGWDKGSGPGGGGDLDAALTGIVVVKGFERKEKVTSGDTSGADN